MNEEKKLSVLSSDIQNDTSELPPFISKQTLTDQSRTLPVDTKIQINAWYYVKGIIFLGLMILAVLSLSFGYMSLHGIYIVDRLVQPEKPLALDYIGGKANPFSIGMEILFWSLIGVICQMAYLSGQMMVKGQFEFGKYFIMWISTSLFAGGVAHAVIFALLVIKLSIAGIEITLENAPISTIIAISFILGFYNQEARRLLDKLRGKITAGFEDDARKQKNGTST